MNSMLSLIWGLFIHWENLRFSIFVHKKKTKEEKDHIILTNKKIKKKKNSIFTFYLQKQVNNSTFFLKIILHFILFLKIIFK